MFVTRIQLDHSKENLTLVEIGKRNPLNETNILTRKRKLYLNIKALASFVDNLEYPQLGGSSC